MIDWSPAQSKRSIIAQAANWEGFCDQEVNGYCCARPAKGSWTWRTGKTEEMCGIHFRWAKHNDPRRL